MMATIVIEPDVTQIAEDPNDKFKREVDVLHKSLKGTNWKIKEVHR